MLKKFHMEIGVEKQPKEFQHPFSLSHPHQIPTNLQ